MFRRRLDEVLILDVVIDPNFFFSKTHSTLSFQSFCARGLHS
jgi:hypothetical protein